MNERARMPVVSLVGVSIEQPNGDVLLRNASLKLDRGEVVLLVGRVGGGKSTLLRVLAGLLSNGQSGWTISGQLMVQGRPPVDLARETCAAGAMVFQDHALFDDLTVRENIDISATHAERRSGVGDRLADALVRGIPPDGSIGLGSGGQKQLVAIARTVISDPPVLLLDEPNSGLDAASTARLIGLLDAIKRDAQCPLLIAAHHVVDLLPIVDRVVLLDADKQSLVPLVPEAAVIEQRLREPGRADRRERPAADSALGDDVRPRAGTEAAPRRSQLFWQWRFFRQYLWSLCFSPEALLYMALGGLLVGFVSTWFTFRHFPLSGFLTPLFHQELLASIGFIQFRILVPLMTGILLASRSAAIIAADLGHRVYSRQVDAMRNLRIPHHGYLSANIIAATLIASIIGVGFMFMISAWVSQVTWSFVFPDETRQLWRAQFFSAILKQDSPLPVGIGWLSAKTAICAVTIAAASIRLGGSAKTSVIDLNRGIAVAVVTAVALVLAIHTAIALVEF